MSSIKEEILERELNNADYINDKLVILINGISKSGKDTLIKNFTDNNKEYKTINFSTIQPIVNLFLTNSIHNDVKTNEWRNLLHKTKMLLDEYNGYSILYTVSIFNQFISNDNKILFIQVGEQENIDLFKKYFNKICRTVSLFIVDGTKTVDENVSACSDPRFDNKNVKLNSYDYIFENKTKFGEKRDFSDFDNFIKKLYGESPINVYIFYTINQPNHEDINYFRITDTNNCQRTAYIYYMASTTTMEKYICDQYLKTEKMGNEIYSFISQMLSQHIYHIIKLNIINIINNFIKKKNVINTTDIVFIVPQYLMDYIKFSPKMSKLVNDGVVLNSFILDYHDRTIMRHNESLELFDINKEEDYIVKYIHNNLL